MRKQRALIACVLALFAGAATFAGVMTSAGAVAPGLPGRILFLRPTNLDEQVFTVNSDGTDAKQISRELSSIYAASWSGDGGRIGYGTNGAGWMFSMAADGSDRQALFGPSNYFLMAGPKLSPDGSKFAFFDSSTGNLATVNIDGTDRRQLTSDGYALLPDWSPDGSQLVYQHYNEATQERSIWMVGADGSNQRAIPGTIGGGGGASLSPDGTTIAFAREGTPGSARVYLVNTDGSGLYAIGPDTGSNIEPTWSPDGGKLAFTHDNTLWVMDANGTDAHQLVDGVAYQPDWQPLPVPPGVTTTTFLRTTSTSTTTTSTTAPNAAPVPQITTFWSSPLTIATSGNRSSDPDGSIVSYQWNWGDYSSPTKTKIASHSYAKAGDYLVRLTVVDNRGAKATTPLWVRVR